MVLPHGHARRWERTRSRDQVPRTGAQRTGATISQARGGVAEPLEQVRLEGTGWRRAGLVVLELGHHGRRQGGIRLEGVL